jgi:hypothetical protein
MATTTPNFGWVVPTSTDLVKNGATAIETLGDSIDASFVGLKGGTTGQVLSKTSGTDLAFTWVAQDDSNAIQNAIVDAKGDLIGATAADTPARLAVGTNGQVLTADSTAATGLKWATAGSSFSGCLAYNTYGPVYSRSLTADTNETISWDNEAFDTDGYHSTSTNSSRLTIPTGKSGYYEIYGAAWVVKNSVNGAFAMYFKKNGGNFTPNLFAAGENGTFKQNQILARTTVYLAAADYVTMQLFSSNIDAQMNYDSSYFGIQYLGA